MNNAQHRFFDMLIDTIKGNVEEGNKKEAAALFLHAARLAEVAKMGGKQK